jgi:hypothetical protein
MPADTLYPDILGVSDAKTVKSYITYNPEAASAVYSQKVKDGFELGNITIKHPNDSVCNSIAKELAGHWQQTMSCFINIEELSSYEVSSAFAYGGFDIMIAPIKSAPNTVSAYNAELGFDAPLGESRVHLVKENNVPIRGDLFSALVALAMVVSAVGKGNVKIGHVLAGEGVFHRCVNDSFSSRRI